MFINYNRDVEIKNTEMDSTDLLKVSTVFIFPTVSLKTNLGKLPFFHTAVVTSRLDWRDVANSYIFLLANQDSTWGSCIL